MNAPAEQGRTTLADLYRDRELSEAQVRRIVAALHLTDRPKSRAPARAA